MKNQIKELVKANKDVSFDKALKHFRSTLFKLGQETNEIGSHPGITRDTIVCNLDTKLQDLLLSYEVMKEKIKEENPNSTGDEFYNFISFNTVSEKN